MIGRFYGSVKDALSMDVPLLLREVQMRPMISVSTSVAWLSGNHKL